MSLRLAVANLHRPGGLTERDGLGFKTDRAENAADLKAALGGLKGPLMKVAQIMATIPDALPKEYVEQLQQLQANAPAMGWPFVKRRMAAETGMRSNWIVAPTPERLQIWPISATRPSEMSIALRASVTPPGGRSHS